MKRAAINAIALVGALLFCGQMQAGQWHRPFTYNRPASARANWGLA